MARNTLYNEIRRAKRIAGINSIKRHGFGASTHKMLSQPEAGLYFQELTEALEAAKNKLTDEQRQAIDTFQDSDSVFNKTSEQKNCSKEAYKKRLKRARKSIMEFLAPFFVDRKRRKKD
jgi:DNA-directed RNA polymerase specialized sigma24 family protein